MKTQTLLGVALAAAAAVAACGGGANTNQLGGGGPGDDGTVLPGDDNGGDTGGDTTGGDTTGGDTTGSTPTNSPGGKAYFTANVYPFISSNCGTCHTATGPGPQWVDTASADNTYKMMFQLGYVSKTSRILLKGPHGGVTTNVLTPEQQTAFNTWVDMELSDGGQKAPPNVLDKLATCIDPQLFEDMGLQDLRTIRRDNENRNNCTGCDRAYCRTCHSGDSGSGFVMAIGNNVLPKDYTFNETKLTNPPYLQKYFGVSPTGEPIASNAIKLKAEATQKDKPYTHPMFKLSAETEANIQAFVDDAIAKYKAGTCGK